MDTTAETKDTNIKMSSFWPWPLVAGFLAVIFDYLFFNKIWGVSVTIYGVLVLGMLFWFTRSRQLNFKPAQWFVLPYLIFIFVPMLRANGFVDFLNALGALGMYLLMVRAVTLDNINNFSLADYFFTAVLWPFKFLGRGFGALFSLLRGAQNVQLGKSRQVLIGVLTALPVLVFFGILFAAADLAFRQFIANTFAWHLPDTLIPQVVVIIIIFILCMGLFAYLFNPSDKISGELSELLNIASPLGNENGENRKIEIAVFLFLIAALFLLFILFQMHYMFGGAINISFAGYTYAEYARKGFWELLIVAFSTLLILLSVDHYTSKLAARTKWFILPALLIAAEVMVIIISAFQRLALYQAAYGMTEMRLYVFGFITFLAAIFVLLAIKLIQNKPHAFFALGTIIILICFFVGMDILNPDKYVAQKNLTQFAGTDKLDAKYLLSLSADATPVILEKFNPTTEEDKQLQRDYIEKSKQKLPKTESWQSYNIAREKALQLARQQ